MSGQKKTGEGRPLLRVVIKEEFVALTGDYKRAIILGQLEYWQKRAREFDEFLAEESARMEDTPNVEPRHGWVYKTAEGLSEETLMGISKQAMRGHLKALVDAGWVVQRNNPDQAWDRTLQYRLDLVKIARDLRALGYTLQGWTTVSPSSNTVPPSSKTEHRSSDSGPAIPEITSEITSEVPVGTSKDVTPLKADTFTAYLAEELDGADVPLLGKRKDRYAGEFRKHLDKGVEDALLYKCADRIIERWTGDDHYKLSVEQAYADVVNGKPPAHTSNGKLGGGSARKDEGSPPEAIKILKQHSELRVYADIAETYDFTKPGPVDWWIRQQIDGGNNANATLLASRIKTLCSSAKPKEVGNG